ncbi:MAG: nickel-dependent hydrogenase large subunit [Deltaproteobacteria bacterium]|nr:nickel-dependent hydrogenase large subunit [Deltaproteobacteria bacterium]
MSQTLIQQFQRTEGIIGLTLFETKDRRQVVFNSGQSTHLEEKLKGRYPLEPIHLTQLLSSKNGIFHAMASVLAIEDYFKLKPTLIAGHIRQLMMQIATIHSHIHHFYWESLPNYLHRKHLEKVENKDLVYFPRLVDRDKDSGDLSIKTGGSILKHVAMAAETLNVLQKTLAILGGKYPIVMNLIPGGVTNFKNEKDKLMIILNKLERLKPFIEEVWPADVKQFTQDIPETTKVIFPNLNLISFGSVPVEKIADQSTGLYISGVLIDGKLEPLNDFKITESFDNTFYVPIDEQGELNADLYDVNKKGAYTWIKSARYEGESMLTGPLARMMITHFGGGNLEISDSIGHMINNLGLTSDSYNCVASRMFAEVFEARYHLKSIFHSLLAINQQSDLNLKRPFDFSDGGTGTGRVEAPGGSLMHQTYIKGDQIMQYRIISPMNWNFSTRDKNNRSGIVEREMNHFFQENELSEFQANRVFTSYYPQALDGTQ